MYTLVYTNYFLIQHYMTCPHLTKPINLYSIVYTKRYSLSLFFMETKMPTEPKEMIRVSVSEAARLFGVNTQTIRRAIQSQEITYVVVGGRYKLNFESLVKWSQRRTTIRNKLASRGIGQFVSKWKIKNPLYSPNPKTLKHKTDPPPGGETSTPNIT